jgi:hypothetical protein
MHTETSSMLKLRANELRFHLMADTLGPESYINRIIEDASVAVLAAKQSSNHFA